ncbi:MAG: hypothetical protein ACKVLN_00045 [Rhodobacterales bacterium]|jgi:hypothetical protein
MKKVILAAALIVMGSTSFAGNMTEPVMEAPIIIEETAQANSSSGILLQLILIALVAAAAV